MALRLAINGLGRISSQLIRVVGEGGFSDLFEIVAIHDKAGPQGILRALKNDSIYGPFPRELTLEEDILTIGDQEITLSANDEGRNATWGKTDVALVVVDGSAACNASTLDQHLKKGAKRVVLPTASALADVNIGIGINEEHYDADNHNIVASAGGAPAAISILMRLFEELGKVRSGSATVVAPATGARPLLDSPAFAGGQRLWPVPVIESTVYEQLVGKLANRLHIDEIETPAQAVGSVTLGVWLEQKTSLDAVLEMMTTAEASDDLIGLLGSNPGVLSSDDLLRDPRTFVLDASKTTILYDTFVSVHAWYDAEFGAACRLADTLALICEEGVPGTA